MGNEKNFMQLIAEGDPALYDTLYSKTLKRVIQFVLKNNGDTTDAEDVFQRALIQIAVRYQKEKVALYGNAEGYVFTVCKNLWRRDLKLSKTDHKEAFYFESLTEEEDICASALEQKRWELIQKARNVIIGNCKDILDFYFAKVSATVIMEEMGYASETVVRQRIFKCKKKLIEQIENDPNYHHLKNS